jgi:hypothetical protein
LGWVGFNLNLIDEFWIGVGTSYLPSPLSPLLVFVWRAVVSPSSLVHLPQAPFLDAFHCVAYTDYFFFSFDPHFWFLVRFFLAWVV